MPNIPFLWLGLFPILFAGSVGQPGRIRSVSASFDSTSVPELLNTVGIGFTFVFDNGKAESTRGWMGGRIPWRTLQISSPQGRVQEGVLTFDRQKVWNNGHTVSFRIRWGDAAVTCSLPLPYVRHIRFNLYTDSIKRNIPFYLNVEGRFSSGRVYPLDTGMVSFTASAGTLTANVLEVKKSDTAVHQVEVSARLKEDPRLRAAVSVPVKIMPDTATLPTTRQLLREWKREERRQGSAVR